MPDPTGCALVPRFLVNIVFLASGLCSMTVGWAGAKGYKPTLGQVRLPVALDPLRG